VKPAPRLPDDEARAELLRALDLLDSPPEELFDRLTRLAATLLDVPMALLSVLDRDRQFFKSAHGLPVRETPREVSFCGHALTQDEPLVVPDAALDPRFMDNPLVCGMPYIRFYAGVQLHSTNGLVLGTLCALDTRPRQLRPEQLRALQDVAAIAQREIVHRESMRLSRSISEQSAEALRTSELRLSATFEQAAVGMAVFSPSGSWLRVNQRLCDLLRYSEAQLTALDLARLVHDDDLPHTRLQAVELLHGRGAWCSRELRLLRSDGQPIWVNVTASLVAQAPGAPPNVLAVVEDIQDRKHMERALAALTEDLERRVAERTAELQTANVRLSEALLREQASQRDARSRELELRAVLENAHDAYIAIDQDGTIFDWNRQAELTFGWSREEAVGLKLDETIIPVPFREAHRKGLAHFLSTGEGPALNRRLELSALRRDGELLPVELRITVLPSLSGRQMFCAFLHDISERHALQQRLARQSLEDELTGLANRRALYDQLAAAMARCRRSGKAMGVLFLDLDGFKAVNDSLGHQVGDELLRQLARRLQEALRATDAVARLGGDEFVVVLEALHEPAPDCTRVALKLIDTVSQAFELGEGRSVRVGTSIGAVVYRQHDATTADALLLQADAAMYEAKRQGKGRVHLVDLGPACGMPSH
jgi:diguanylate cyclase (GGDEF)-like protein/PAS domain S-box-containing protein